MVVFNKAKVLLKDSTKDLTKVGYPTLRTKMIVLILVDQLFLSIVHIEGTIVVIV